MNFEDKIIWIKVSYSFDLSCRLTTFKIRMVVGNTSTL